MSCGELSPQPICLSCCKAFAELIAEKRIAFTNNLFKQFEKEADDIYEKDPTKGRGRGPKWMNSSTW